MDACQAVCKCPILFSAPVLGKVKEGMKERDVPPLSVMFEELDAGKAKAACWVVKNNVTTK